MLISIVTAVLNRAHSIGGSLDSLAAQTHRPIEHVVQDGGSTDGTLDLLKQKELPGTRFVSEPDTGIYDALNKGLERCTGDVVGLLHSDDFFADDEVLARVAAGFEDPEIDAVYGDLDYVSQHDTTRRLRAWRSQPFSPELLRRGWMPPHPTLFLRRRVIDEVGLYDTSYRIAADYDYVLRCFRRPGFQALHLPEVLVHMRTGGASNRSLSHIFKKSREDFRTLRRNEVGGAMTLLRKNFSKLTQFNPKHR